MSTVKDLLRPILGPPVRAYRKRRALAGGDAPAEWYDEAYSAEESYKIHWSESQYLLVWQAISDRLPEGSRVLEVGCGPGQMAHMLLDQGKIASYVGFDFSAKAIDLARGLLPEQRFEVADAHTADLFETVDYDTVLCTEVLEHITEDISVIERIPAGKRVLATVPDFDYTTHVRFFKDVAEVRARYGPHFAELEITTHLHANDPQGRKGTFFLMNGVR